MRMKTDDTALAMQAAEGDAAAFEALLARHYELIFRLAWRFTRNREDAEDITQEICLSLADRISKFSARAKFTTWLYQVVLNHCRDFLRRNETRYRKQSEFAEAEALQRAEQSHREEQQERLLDLIDEVGGELKETAVLILSEGLSHGEAARVLSVKESTVSWRMHELKKRLKQLAEKA